MEYLVYLEEKKQEKHPELKEIAKSTYFE